MVSELMPDDNAAWGLRTPIILCGLTDFTTEPDGLVSRKRNKSTSLDTGVRVWWLFSCDKTRAAYL
jgi:hypothetical protein